MTGVSVWPALCVLLPLIGATVATLSERHAARLAVLASLATLGASLALATHVAREGTGVHHLGGWLAPIGITLVADGLASLLVLITAGVGLGVAIYARTYFGARPHEAPAAPPAERAARYFAPLWLFLWSALNGVYLAGDIFNAYVALELLGISAVAIVALPGTAAATTAALRYLFVSLLGSLLYLLGVALLYRTYGTLSIMQLAEFGPHGASATTALLVMTLGLAMKTALFPLHAWLPAAHAAAPAPGSAVLSALVVKASFFLLLRIWLQIFSASAHGAAATLLGALGAVAVLWGSYLALRQRKLKRLIAYSTVAQLGYLFLIFPLWRDAPELALQGGTLHLTAHAFAKAAMFLAAGSMMHALGDDGLDTIAGVGQRMPLAFAAFGLGGLNLAGLPPSGGFLGKWLLLTAAIGAGAWLWVGVIVAGSLLAAGYVFLVLRAAFMRPDAARHVPATPLRLDAVAFSLALVAVALGVWGTIPLALLGAPFGSGP